MYLKVCLRSLLPFFLVIVLAITCVKFLNIRIKKTILLNFSQVIIKNIAQSMEVLTKETQEIKIEDDILLGNDVSFEQKFLNNVNDKCSEEIENCKV